MPRIIGSGRTASTGGCLRTLVVVLSFGWLALAGNPARAAGDEAWPAEVTAEQIADVQSALRVKQVHRDRHAVREPSPRLLSPSQRRVLDIALDPARAPNVASEECDDEAFATKTGDALVEHIRTTPYECTNRMFSEVPSRFAAFAKRNMIDVAEAAEPLALAYDGTNSGRLAELFLFLRAGFYVEYNEGELDWTEPDDDIAAAVASLLDALRPTPTSTTRRARIAGTRCGRPQSSWTTWLEDRPIWNLEHEQVHYLDGRFNMHGSFSDYRVDTHHTLWWAEGLAEYISKRNDNRTAVDIGRAGKLKLSEIFPVVNTDGTTLVYRWCYLAVRFMFERHRDVVDELLAYFRVGDYEAYRHYLREEIGAVYDAEWTAWLLDAAVTDAETPDLVDLPRRLAVDEGSTSTYAIALAVKPDADVDVHVAALGADIEPEPTSLTFSTQDWNVAKAVRVTAFEDDNSFHETATLVHTASGGGYDTVRARVTVAVADNATTISFVDARVSAKEGATAVLDVAIGRALESATTFSYRVGPDADPATPDADTADHGAGAGEATIPAGGTRAQIEIPVRDDEEIEPAREFLEVSLDPSTIKRFVPQATRAAVVIEEGVCDRTPGVRDALRDDRPCEAVTVQDLADLTYLNLAEQLGGSLRRGDFQGLTRVRDIRLYRNGLRTIPAAMFADMHALTKLFLGRNDLGELPTRAFEGADRLERVHLYDNDLQNR